MRRLALLVGLLTRGCLSRMCNRNDVIVEAEGERVWTMAGCTGLDLSCPNATREAPCNNSLVKGDLPALVLGLGETGQELTSIELRGNWVGPHGATTLLSESCVSLIERKLKQVQLLVSRAASRATPSYLSACARLSVTRSNTPASP
jgi:hypothetical protein